jgi:SAM-dependent methyltransferase
LLGIVQIPLGARDLQEIVMKVGAIPENLVERLLNAFGALPTPLLDTFQALMLARTIMVATKLGVFEALRDRSAAAGDVAAHIGTNKTSTEKLLNGLVGAGYLTWQNGQYRLARVARKWLLKDSPCSLHDNMLHRFLEWEIAEHFEDFVRTGKALDVHAGLTAEKWETYQRGMRSLAGLSAQEVAGRLPMPRGATTLLDIGGSHGYYSVALCRRHAGLTATILDLPEAVAAARPILAKENMGDRMVFRAENAVAANLGNEQWDVVFMSQFLHHLDADTSRQLLSRVARSLRPGGVAAIVEVIRPDKPSTAGQTGALLDLFFAVTSLSGTSSIAELTAWQREAGLVPAKPIWLRTLPGAAIQPAYKSK